MPEFMMGPELDSAVDALTQQKQKITAKNLGSIVPGGLTQIREILSGPIMSNPALDVVGGVGQYKIPQRFLGALAGGMFLGDQEQPISTGGAIGGYALSALLDEAIREARKSKLDRGFDVLKNSGTLIDADENTFIKLLDQVKAEAKNKNLKNILVKDQALDILSKYIPGATVPEALSDMSHNSGREIIQSYYTGNMLDDAAINAVKNKVKKLPAGMPEFPGFDPETFKQNMMNRVSYMDSLKTDFANLGLTRDSLLSTGYDKSIKGHELYELLESMDETRLPMSGGEFSRTGKNIAGISGVSANHNSPAVLLGESNLNARILGPEGARLSETVRNNTGERALFNNLMNLDLDNVVLTEGKISDMSDDIAKAVGALKINKVPPKELLDKIKINKLVSILGSAGRSVSNFEHNLVNALKGLARKIR